jgi:hypothetical protein
MQHLTVLWAEMRGFVAKSSPPLVSMAIDNA